MGRVGQQHSVRERRLRLARPQGRNGRGQIDGRHRAQGDGGKFEQGAAAELLAREFDRRELSAKGLQYERLDQLTMDILLGVR